MQNTLNGIKYQNVSYCTECTLLIWFSFIVDESSDTISTSSKTAASKGEEDENKPVEEQIEGRFFIKDKLCALGLADVST
jgi:hypothetical protein